MSPENTPENQMSQLLEPIIKIFQAQNTSLPVHTANNALHFLEDNTDNKTGPTGQHIKNTDYEDIKSLLVFHILSMLYGRIYNDVDCNTFMKLLLTFKL